MMKGLSEVSNGCGNGDTFLHWRRDFSLVAALRWLIRFVFPRIARSCDVRVWLPKVDVRLGDMLPYLDLDEGSPLILTLPSNAHGIPPKGCINSMVIEN
eukprot:scaffold37799_cov176-Amphora_coffeaeformis.AAC.4